MRASLRGLGERVQPTLQSPPPAPSVPPTNEAAALRAIGREPRPFARPTVIIFELHDAGRQMTPGANVPIPEVERFASDGVTFRQAFAAAPTCSPSRAGLLTGCHPHENGMMGLAHLGFSLADYDKTLQGWLRKAGYRSAVVGMDHTHPDRSKAGPKAGWDERVEVKSDHIEDVVPAALQHIEERVRANDYGGRLYYIGTEELHRDPVGGFYHSASQPSESPPPAPLPDDPEVRRDWADFQASARVVSESFGRFIEKLDELGVGENTLVIFTTDHGIAFPEMKSKLTDHGTGVTMILRGPGFTGGKSSDALVSQLDLFPTICDLAGIARPAWLRGKPLQPVAGGEEIHDAIFTETTFHVAEEKRRAIRTKEWLLIESFDEREHPPLANTDDSPSKRAMMPMLRARVDPALQLFDLASDPDQMVDVARYATNAPIVEALRTRLREWMVETNDPLAFGIDPTPAGALLLDPDAESAG